jgi:hypothetical protein
VPLFVEVIKQNRTNQPKRLPNAILKLKKPPIMDGFFSYEVGIE